MTSEKTPLVRDVQHDGTERYCAAVAAMEEHDPVGYGSNAARVLFVEVAPPWGQHFYDGDSNGDIWQRLRHIQVAFNDSHRVNGELIYPTTGLPLFYGIAPDEEWSPAGTRRVLLMDRPAGPAGEFERKEYRFPDHSLAVVEMLRAYYHEPEALSAFERYRVESPAVRDFFVCTHGSVDLCCGMVGVPLYRHIRNAYPEVRAWRTTHFGGHRFAPTAWEFPNGYKWAFLDDESARRVIRRDVPPSAVARKVRGWSGGPAAVQVLDREGLIRFGWDWFRFRRQGEILSVDETERRWQVRLDFASPAGRTGVLEAEIGVRRELDAFGCGKEWGKYDERLSEYEVRLLTIQELSVAER